MGIRAGPGLCKMASRSKSRRQAEKVDPKPGIVTQVFDRVRQIKLKHPDQSRRIDVAERDIRDRLMRIKDTIDEFPRIEKELITVLVINGVHKMCDEILIDYDVEDDAGQDAE